MQGGGSVPAGAGADVSGGLPMDSEAGRKMNPELAENPEV